MKASETPQVSKEDVRSFRATKEILRTLCSQVFYSVEVIHNLQSFSLFPCQRLFIVVFTRPPDPIQKDPSATRMPKEVEDSEYEHHKGCRTKGGKHSNKNSFPC